MKFDTVLGLKIDVMQESNNGEIPEEILGLLEKKKKWLEIRKIGKNLMKYEIIKKKRIYG